MKTYSVREFADLAGVTVRTLHYYDQTGLLTASRRNGGRHRQYRERELLRLQQILTLKEVGFTLEEIRALLENPAISLQDALLMQKEAVDQRIEQLQRVSAALELIMQAQSEYDWETVIAAIRGLTASEESKVWLMQHYDAAAHDQVLSRASAMTPDDVMAGVQAWVDLGNDFQALRHLPPEHPDVQRLVVRMVALIDEFTQGNPDILNALQSMYSNPEQMPAEFRPVDTDLFTFMNEARRIYEERKQT